jgi:hypothetical protein
MRGIESIGPFEGGRILLSLDEAIELFQLADEVGAAEFNLLIFAARAGCVRIDGHGVRVSFETECTRATPVRKPPWLWRPAGSGILT